MDVESQRLHEAPLHDVENHAHPHVVEGRCDPRARETPRREHLLHHQSSDVATEWLPGLHAGDLGELGERPRVVVERDVDAGDGATEERRQVGRFFQLRIGGGGRLRGGHGQHDRSLGARMPHDGQHEHRERQRESDRARETPIPHLLELEPPP
jgi:hypothetical protein